MGRKRSRKQSPLFYINQPVIDLPQADMQKNYTIKSEPDTSEILQEQGDVLVTKEMIFEDKESSEVKVNHQVEEKENIQSDQSDVRGKRSFNDYTLEEKIKHLKFVPASVAKVKYEFITVGRSYKGFFIEMKGEVLFIQSVTPRKKSVSIPKEDLIDIKRVGL
ncbi:hypothetical protein QNH36_07420 [Mesobacillus sp. AQ2]|jgi:hypothetical protein|uniref:CotO family spore coat protein n=1 Tax=Bacillaceae TaxID=186817 RepID=UPI0011A72046|nr:MULTISPECIES: CotO family spore coat protein [Bacillaceae]MCM3124821.1 spore coat CotO family protein [Mesobacillus sp. MER 33]MCM3232870.1 spore coat CotO family protein [Mesobacillus sp. MER 48]WHX41956.1 hypothetical protein QNH36_07420 [Mesobacillus sp. AQ2]